MGEVEVQTDLAAWLLACIDEDERNAQVALDEQGGRDWTAVSTAVGLDGRDITPSGNPVAWHISTWDPTRALAECDVKRGILGEHSQLHTVVDGYCVDCGGDCTHNGETWCAYCGQDPCRTLMFMALPYVDRPGYRPEWRPEWRPQTEGDQP